MWRFLLLLLLFSASNAASRSIRIHHAEVFRLKCESLPYRSLVEQTSCVFAIPFETEYAAGDKACGDVLPGAQMAADSGSARLLKLMFLNPSTYHDASSKAMKKSVMCRYISDYDCKEGSLELPGRCISRSTERVTWTEAEKFCREQDSTNVVIRNADENVIYASVLKGSESGWMLPGHETSKNWSAGEENVGYWSWFFDGTAGAVGGLKCAANQHAVISRKPEKECAVFGGWKADDSDNKNIALCTRDADCPFCPAGEIKTTPVPSNSGSTVTASVTPGPECAPRNDPPRQDMLWNLKYYYNWGRILHAFAATSEGKRQIMRNGIGYSGSRGSGSLGMTISDEGYAKLEQVCSDPEQRKKIVKMWFRKRGQSYQHNFIGSGVYVGYVATERNACGSVLPIKRWSCLVSADMMYARNLNWNTWYRGRQQNRGRIMFWLWEGNAAKRDKQRQWSSCTLPSTTPAPDPMNQRPADASLQPLSAYYNSKLVMHAFAADEAGLKLIMATNGGYDPKEGVEVIGRTLKADQLEVLKKTCKNAVKLVKLFFTRPKKQIYYVHTFGKGSIFVGYAAINYNDCEARVGIKQYSASISRDQMYSSDYEANVWYKGRAVNGGQIKFYLW